MIVYLLGVLVSYCIMGIAVKINKPKKQELIAWMPLYILLPWLSWFAVVFQIGATIIVTAAKNNKNENNP